MEYGLSLGSNTGDRLGNLESACLMIANIDGVSVIARASVYETSPVDVLPEYDHLLFFNTIVIIDTELLPALLHAELVIIESKLGRVRGNEQNTPRPIDIDLIYAEGVVSDTVTLTLPHPRWSERRFVVEPLAEVRPSLIIDKKQGCIKDVLLSLPAEGCRRLD